MAGTFYRGRESASLVFQHRHLLVEETPHVVLIDPGHSLGSWQAATSASGVGRQRSPLPSPPPHSPAGQRRLPVAGALAYHLPHRGPRLFSQEWGGPGHPSTRPHTEVTFVCPQFAKETWRMGRFKGFASKRLKLISGFIKSTFCATSVLSAALTHFCLLLPYFTLQLIQYAFY